MNQDFLKLLWNKFHNLYNTCIYLLFSIVCLLIIGLIIYNNFNEVELEFYSFYILLSLAFMGSTYLLIYLVQYKDGINIKSYYLSMSKKQLAHEINNEINKKGMLYVYSKEDLKNKPLHKQFLNANLVLLRKFLIVIEANGLCHVLPTKEINWIGSIKAKESINNNNKDQVSNYICIFARDTVLYVKSDKKMAKRVCDILSNKISNFILDRKTFCENELLQNLNDSDPTEKLENLFILDRESYIKIMEGQLLTKNKLA